eukprot:11205453-Lingulodinium_polyedra.AAC.1
MFFWGRGRRWNSSCDAQHPTTPTIPICLFFLQHVFMSRIANRRRHYAPAQQAAATRAFVRVPQVGLQSGCYVMMRSIVNVGQARAP